jgi:16S rRNA (cytosine967-C5)-methyltransferase
MKTETNANSARLGAIQSVAGLLGGAALDSELQRHDANLPDARDRSLMRAISYAVVRQYYRYEALLTILLTQDLARLDLKVRAALICGLAQLDQAITPSYAAISVTVDAVRKLGYAKYAGLVNAVLRRFQRESSNLLGQLPNNDVQRFQHPLWLINRIKKSWPDRWQSILGYNNLSAPMMLRVNRLKVTRAQYLEQLRSAQIDAYEVPFLSDAIKLSSSIDVHSLPGFGDGLCSVQDSNAQWAVELLKLAPGLRVLDACAAPGGKTAHILERQPDIAQLVSLDIDHKRVEKINSTLLRLGFTANGKVTDKTNLSAQQLKVVVKVADAADPSRWFDGIKFDRILLDAPCSGTGVIRRHPDIRLLRRPSDLESLTQQQDRLLDALWSLLAPGGRLIYVTCSILREENAERIAAFLARTPQATHADDMPKSLGQVDGGGRQIVTDEHGGDGFFYAVLRAK